MSNIFSDGGQGSNALIVRLGQDVVKIVLLLNELLRHGEVVIVVARQISLPGSEASNSHALAELEVTVIQERQLTEGALSLQDFRAIRTRKALCRVRREEQAVAHGP